MVLFSYVISIMPVYILLVYVIPEKVIRCMENMFVSFLWGSYQGTPKKRWKSWLLMDMSVEGGLGFKSIRAVLQAFIMKTT